MFPILVSGEKILISNQIMTGKIKRFDIVVVEPPGMNGKRLIKRIIGLPGETIHIKSGDVFINNLYIKEPFLKNKGDVMFRSINMKNKIIPLNSYFLMGDHREKSTDSRNFGPLHRNNILGKTIFRYWPIKKLGFIN